MERLVLDAQYKQTLARMGPCFWQPEFTSRQQPCACPVEQARRDALRGEHAWTRSKNDDSLADLKNVFYSPVAKNPLRRLQPIKILQCQESDAFGFTE
jgi:hypothetical protein